MKENAGHRLLEAFNQLTANNIDSLDTVYAKNVHFQDPLHEYDNLTELKKYLAYQYKNTISCRFDLVSMVHQKNETSIEWTMTFRHKALNFGKEIIVPGISLVTEDPETGLITRHRDYFDVSAFIYENIPGLGKIIKTAKSWL